MSHPVALLVTVEINPNQIKEFRDFIAWDAAESLTKENGGCLRFDVLDVPSPFNNKFIFYEVYANAAALDYHMSTPHFAKWTEFQDNGGVLNVDIDSPIPFVLGERRIERKEE